MQHLYKIRIKKGDTIIVRSGKYKGKTAKVLSTKPSDNTLIAEGINVVKKHQKPTKQFPQGGIIDITKPIDVSKVAIYDAVNKKPARIQYKIKADGSKTRIYSTTKTEIKS
jgi:large subunit ribosomal protein L24